MPWIYVEWENFFLTLSPMYKGGYGAPSILSWRIMRINQSENAGVSGYHKEHFATYEEGLQSLLELLRAAVYGGCTP